MSRPIIPILISYLLGLIAGFYLHIPFHIIIALLFGSVSMTAASILIRRVPLIFFTLSILTLFILGTARMEGILSPALPENHVANISSDEPLSLEGTIYEPPERGLDKTKLYIDLSRLYIGDAPYPITGKLLLTIGNNAPVGAAHPTILKYGNTIRFLAKVRRPRSFRNPGGFDYERFLAMKGIFATAYLKNSEGIVKTNEEKPSYRGWIEGIRDSIRENVFKNAGDTAPVLLAMITGEQGEIPRETREAFSRAGTAHILAISGEHIGIIALISFALFLWLLKRSERLMLTFNAYKAAALMTIPGIALYSLIAGSGFSIVRAAIMGGTALAAVLSDRRKDIPSLLAFAAFLILAFEPQALFDISFQLSFASVLSLSMIFPYLEKLYISRPEETNTRIISWHTINRLLSWLRVLLLITLAATIGTAPLVAYYFNRFSLISPVSNMMIVPFVGFIIVPAGLLSSILIPVSPALSGGLISINSVLISFTVKLTELFSSIPFSSIRVITPNIFEIVIFYLLIIMFIYGKDFKMAGSFLLPVIAFVIAVESFYFFSPLFQKDLRVTFMDVGQGESALIEFPGGKRMLIDGGGLPDTEFDMGERVIAPFLWKKRMMRIDYLVLSHPNSDHYGGLPFIVRNFKINDVWESGIEEGSRGYAEFKGTVEGSKAVHRNVSDGDGLIVDNARVDVLNPPKDHSVGDDRAANNGSIVLKIGYGNTSFLFTGDIEKEAEYRLLPRGDMLKSTVLKVPHHGSLTSSTYDFLEKVRPEKAVFSVGYKNRFGFPKEDVIKRYIDIGSEIYRTDSDGAISVISDGRNARFFKTLNFIK